MGDRLGRPWPLAVADLSEWAHAEPGQGIAYYLLAKNFYVQGYHERASSNLDRAFSRALSPASVEREAWRLRVFSACALGDRPSARRAYAALAADPDLGLARRRSLARFAGRCGI